MLVLSRKPGESITIETSDGPIEVKVVQWVNGKARLGIEAPKKFLVYRTEHRGDWIDGSQPGTKD